MIALVPTDRVLLRSEIPAYMSLLHKTEHPPFWKDCVHLQNRVSKVIALNESDAEIGGVRLPTDNLRTKREPVKPSERITRDCPQPDSLLAQYAFFIKE